MLNLINNTAERDRVARIFQDAPATGKQATGGIMVPYASGFDGAHQLALYGQSFGISLRTQSMSKVKGLKAHDRILTFFGSEGVVVHEEVATPATTAWFRAHQRRCINYRG